MVLSHSFFHLTRSKPGKLASGSTETRLAAMQGSSPPGISLYLLTRSSHSPSRSPGMASRNDPNFAGFLEAARQALEKGDLQAATRQVAAALGEDPNRGEALSLLEEIITAAD